MKMHSILFNVLALTAVSTEALQQCYNDAHTAPRPSKGGSSLSLGVFKW